MCQKRNKVQKSHKNNVDEFKKNIYAMLCHPGQNLSIIKVLVDPNSILAISNIDWGQTISAWNNKSNLVKGIRQEKHRASA